MTTEQQYLERAKDARDKAEAAKDEASRRTWLEIAKGFERLAEVPGKTPWHVEKIEIGERVAERPENRPLGQSAPTPNKDVKKSAT